MLANRPLPPADGCRSDWSRSWSSRGWLRYPSRARHWRSRRRLVRICDEVVLYLSLKTDCSLVKHELAAFRRIVPLMAAHIRLRNSTQWNALKKVTDRAPDGPEKCEMPMKMCINPSKLHDAATRQASYVSACDFYYEEYDKTMAEVEALVKCFGREIGQDHQTGGCFGSRAMVQRQCLHSGVAKEAVVAEAVQELMNEKI